MEKKIFETDVLIIGTGAAGLRAAIEARRYGVDVLVVDKSLIGVNNNTVFAGGGVKAALPWLIKEGMQKLYDTPEEHFLETIKYGAYLNNQRLAEILAIEAPGRLIEMKDFGVKHIENLRLGADNARVGRELTRPMGETCKAMAVRFRPCTTVYDFVLKGGAICGVAAFDSIKGDRMFINAKAIIVATGGAGEVYLRNDTVAQATGEAYSMAFHAGAELIGMELVQIDPYILFEPGLPMWYVPPCDARYLGELRNARGEPFLTKYFPMKGRPEDPFHVRFGVYPPDVREIISRAMYIEVLEGRGDNGAVMLDCRNVPEEEWLKKPMDVYARKAILRGFDLRKKMVHMLPGAIHNLGGIRINERCESNLPGLYAAGECSGLLHGAGRLGGNALSECIVFGAVAGRNAAEYAKGKERVKAKDEFKEKELFLDRLLEAKKNALTPKEAKTTIKTIVWNTAGPVRWEESLKKGLHDLKKVQKEDLPRLQASPQPLQLKEAVEAYHMAYVGEMILRSALLRKESRGSCHYRMDYKKEDNRNWLKNIIVKSVKGKIELETAPIEITRCQPPKP